MMTRRKLIIIFLIIFLVLPLIAFVIFAAFFKPDSTGQETAYKDKDTGETVSTFSGVEPEQEGNPDILILGLTPLSTDILRAHFVFIKDSINDYSNERLKGAYDTVALLPEGYTNDENGNITGFLRLGKEGNLTVPIHITASRFTGEARVIIEDPENRFGGQFDSGVFVHEAE